MNICFGDLLPLKGGSQYTIDHVGREFPVGFGQMPGSEETSLAKITVSIVINGIAIIFLMEYTKTMKKYEIVSEKMNALSY